MCGGMEFARPPERMTDEEWNEAVRGSGAGSSPFIRVFFPNPKAALLLDPASDLWLPWGRRREQPGDWPEGGWAREESLEKGFWRRWHPEPVVVRPVRWMEKDRHRVSRWFDLEEDHGICCLVLTKAPGTPIYVITRQAEGNYLADVHDRIPVVS